MTKPPENTDVPFPEVVSGPEGKALVGLVINNNYRIDRLIGKGGMGEVFEGEHLFTGNRVAIKMVLQSLSREEKIVSLFKREARILFRLTDDAIVRYLDSVYDQVLDRYCLIMDFIDGVALADHVAERGTLTVDEARLLIKRLATGLDKAHQLEITHRDLSPDNVMLRDGRVDQAVLIDFGIARSTQFGDATLHGQFAGKFKYVSPEQLGHFNGVIGPATDIYGLALLVAAALRGSPIDMGGSVVEAVNARRSIPPLTGIPTALQPLLAHMLEPDPTARPARMLDVVRMVDDPSLIPAKYRSLTAPPGEAADRTVISPSAMEAGLTTGGVLRGTTSGGATSGGLTAAGMSYDGTASGGDATIIALPPGAAGATTATAAPDQARRFEGLSVAPQTAPPPPVSTPQRPRLPLLLGGAGLVVALAAGGWFALQPSAPPLPPAETAATTPEASSPASALPPPDTATRDGFLAAFGQDQPCTYATRITAGGNAGKLERFGASEGVLTDLPQQYGAAFGIAPATVDRVISAEQCAALDLLRGLQGRQAVQPSLVIDSDVVSSGGNIIGRVADVRGRAVWLFLVTTSGAIYNVSGRLEPQPDGSQIFGFGMSQAAGSAAQPQLLVALASNAPIASAAAAAEGSAAATILPLVLQEIANGSGGASAQVAYFSLQP